MKHNAQPNQLAPQRYGSGTVVPRVWLRYWLADDESIVAKVLHDNWGSFKSPMPGHGLRAPGL
ncbi:MAG: hypothetical protein GY820_37110, partial [Gammaproteobacteria bacterium]|nr:hypothetical protein [Gammaproteobacteria bacterium]